MSRRIGRLIGLVTILVLVAAMAAACASAPAAAPTAAPAKPAAAPAQPAAPAPPAAAPTKAPEPAKPAAAPTAAPAAFPKMDVKLATAAGTDMLYQKGAERFGELLKQRTNGAINLQIFPNAQLGNEKDITEQVKNGIIPMAIVSGGMLAAFPGWEPVGVFGMPYLFKGDSEADQMKALTVLARGPIMKEISESGAKTSGIRSLDHAWWYGLRHLTTKGKQVAKVDDLKNMKVRTPDAPVQKLAMTALGAAVTPMSFTELYTALQLGVVDGQENPLSVIFSNKFYEVQKYLTLTGHMDQQNGPIINDKFFQGLSPALRDIFQKSALEAGDYQNELQVKANNDAVDALKAKGMTVNTINKAEFADKTKDAWKQFESQFGKGLYERVKDTQK